MKELYLALAATALIMIILSISVEVSISGKLNGQQQRNKTPTQQPIIDTNMAPNDLSNGLPNRIYDNNNLNNVFLKPYYANNNSRFSPEKNFYLPN